MSWPDKIAVLEALQEQAHCYRALADLAVQQHRHVRSAGAEGERALLDVLARRQSVMEQVAALEPTLAGVRKQWPEFAETLDTADRSIADRLLTEVRVLLTKITEGDRDDTLVLQQRKLTAGQALRTTNASSNASRRYVGNAYARQKSVDFKG